MAAIVSGIIMIWSGTLLDVPTGYAVCDGENGTPDLRERFIVGAGTEYEPHDTGGQESFEWETSHTHDHPLTVVNNTHGHYTDWYPTSVETPPDQTFQTNALSNQQTSLPESHSHEVRFQFRGTAAAYQHTHTVNFWPLAVAPEATADLRYSYYALFYIMKL